MSEPYSAPDAAVAGRQDVIALLTAFAGEDDEAVAQVWAALGIEVEPGSEADEALLFLTVLALLWVEDRARGRREGVHGFLRRAGLQTARAAL